MAETYNPVTGTWADDGAAAPSAARNYSAALPPNGQVLISGGENGSHPARETLTGAAVLFDPATGSTSTGSMTIPRELHALTVLPDGQVLAAGGVTQNKKGEFSVTATAELFTP